jgi:hypothetical protein
MGLWPGLSDPSDPGTTLPLLSEGLAAVYGNQHPPSCADARFLIAHRARKGFGSNVHAEGELLALAMALGRVMVPAADYVSGDMSWQISWEGCANHTQNTFSCYHLPWSNCTLHDALIGYENVSEFNLPTAETRMTLLDFVFQ